LLSDSKRHQLKQILSGFTDLYEQSYARRFLRKLGIEFDERTAKSDLRLIDSFLNILYSTGADFCQVSIRFCETFSAEIYGQNL
jgi:uncharacterized protein YdiU (UPF0061 family)